MLNMQIPTIENYSEAHADWYRGFSTAFNLSQLSNNLLISYITTQAELNSDYFENTSEYHYGINLCRNGDDRTDLLHSLDIINMLKLIVKDFAATNAKHQDILLFQGLSIEGYYDEDVKVDLNEILESTTEKSWNKLIRGLVNVFEFMYLFSVTEDHLKEVVELTSTTTVVSKALKNKPGLIKHLEEEFKLPRDFMIKLWKFYIEIRNLYAHSFGYINEKDKSSITIKKAAFVEAYENLPFEWHLIDNDLVDTFFDEDKLIVGKMYVMSVSEICVFRNFVRIFIPEFSKWEKQEAVKANAKPDESSAI
nr:hypothetical protein [Pseudomonas bubulae]